LEGGFTKYDRFVYLPIEADDGMLKVWQAALLFDPFSDTVTWKDAPKGFYKGKSETFKSFESVDQLIAHLPPRRV
jgi:hypothetical protein